MAVPVFDHNVVHDIRSDEPTTSDGTHVLGLILDNVSTQMKYALVWQRADAVDKTKWMIVASYWAVWAHSQNVYTTSTGLVVRGTLEEILDAVGEEEMIWGWFDDITHDIIKLFADPDAPDVPPTPTTLTSIERLRSKLLRVYFTDNQGINHT